VGYNRLNSLAYGKNKAVPPRREIIESASLLVEICSAISPWASTVPIIRIDQRVNGGPPNDRTSLAQQAE